MHSQILTAFVGIMGILIGALINSVLNYRALKAKMRNELKYEAYNEFLESISFLQGSLAETPEKWNGLRLSIKSRQKIALIGSHTVVGAVSRFSPNIYKSDGDNFEQLRDVIRAMREDLETQECEGFDKYLTDLLFDLGGHPPPNTGPANV
jgi:hypothetical protein